METALLTYLIGLHPVVGLAVALLGLLVVVGQAYVALTPSKNDDAWYAKLETLPVVGGVLRALVAFAPIQRK